MSWSRPVLVAAAILGNAAAASAAGLSCPTWHDGARLENYSVFDGDPKKLYELTGEDGGFDVHRANSSQPDGFHLVCSYKHAATLDLPIPATITHCDPAGSVLSPAIACR